MKSLGYLFIYELRRLLLSPSTYTLSVLFLVVMGVIYFILLEGLCRIAQGDPLSAQFFSAFWIPLLFVVPLITMRQIAQERRLGIMEVMLTTPAPAWAIVLSKFFAVYLFYLCLWGLTLAFPWLLGQVAPLGPVQQAILNMPGMLGGLCFVAITSFSAVAMGMLATSMSRSQLTAGMLCFSFLFLVVVVGQLLNQLPLVKDPQIRALRSCLDYCQIFMQLEEFSRGILDSRPFILHFSLGVCFLAISSLVVKKYR